MLRESKDRSLANEGKYVVFIKCKQEIPSIIELLEGLHGIDNVMEV